MARSDGYNEGIAGVECGTTFGGLVSKYTRCLHIGLSSSVECFPSQGFYQPGQALPPQPLCALALDMSQQFLSTGSGMQRLEVYPIPEDDE